jgi:hypothetical protein
MLSEIAASRVALEFSPATPALREEEIVIAGLSDAVTYPPSLRALP